MKCFPWTSTGQVPPLCWQAKATRDWSNSQTIFLYEEQKIKEANFRYGAASTPDLAPDPETAFVWTLKRKWSWRSLRVNGSYHSAAYRGTTFKNQNALCLCVNYIKSEADYYQIPHFNLILYWKTQLNVCHNRGRHIPSAIPRNLRGEE